MIPVRLELKNFLPYRSPDPLRFEGMHLVCLTGANGAGKSSLLDAITWALWGRARAKRDDELVHLGQGDMYVQLDFEQEGIVYRVWRRRARGKRGAGTLDLFVLQDDGRLLTISEPAMRATQDKINQILRLDYETFIHSAFLQQGRADAFTTKAPAQRKKILSDILGLEQWSRYEDAVKERLKAIATELETIRLRVIEIDDELAKEPGLRTDVAEQEAAHQEAQEALRVAEAALAEVAHAAGDLRRAQEQQAAQERRLREHERDLETVAEEIARHEERIATYEAVIATRQEIETGYATLQAARETDQTLGQTLRQLSDVDTRYHDLQRQLDATRAELESEKSGYEGRIAELGRALDQDHQADMAEAQSEVIALEDLDAQRDSLQESLSRLGEERAALEAENNALRDEMFSLRKQLDQIETIEDARCPLCGQDLDDAHRQQLVAQLEAEGTQRGDRFRTNQGRLDTITDETSEHRVRIDELGLELKRLAPLRERVGVLQAQIDAATNAQIRIDKEQADLNAVQAMLESDSFAQDIRDQLATLEAQRAELGYDRNSHDEVREQLETYRGFEKRQTELEVALESLPDAQSALEGAQKRQARVEKALGEDQAEIEKLAGEIEQLAVLVEEQQRRQNEVNHQRTAERVAFERLTNARQELKALDQQRKRKAELEARRERKLHEDVLYTDLRTAFGKNGIPAMIIETAIPELEAIANDLLSRMTDGRMTLRLTTQREKVTGGVSETLDIEIADELGTRSYELYSGGEAFRINFAIRVALSKLLARRAGAHLRTLFIDEGFGTQDASGRDRLVEAINAVQDDFDLVLVITHIDELRDSFPVHVLVEKTTQGSRVSVH